MAIQYQSIVEKAFTRGINQLAAEAAIPAGHIEDCLNADAAPEGQLEKRKGFETHGWLPLRVVSVEQTAGALGPICFTLDDSIDVSQLKPAPILVQGRANFGTSGYDFDTTAGYRYYSTFSVDVRKTFTALSTTTQTLTAAEHGIGNATVMLGIVESTSETTRSNSVIIPNAQSIDTGTFDVTTEIINPDPDDLKAYIYAIDNSSLAGERYTTTFTSPYSPGIGYNYVDILAATHGFTGTDIMVQCFGISGTTATLFTPDVIRNTGGNIQIRWTTDPATTVRVCLRNIGMAQVATGTAAAGETITVTFSDLETHFVLVQPYLDDNAGLLTAVIPDSIVVDAVANTATVTFQNNTASSASFRVLLEYATARTNIICVEPHTIAGVDVSAGVGSTALTLWGLDHASIYAEPRTGKPGWVTSTDSYKSEGDAYLCATLGWNLFREASRVAEGTTYGMPRRYPYLRHFVALDSTIAPLFHGTGDTVLRTRGGYTIDGGSEGWAEVTNFAYNGTAGQAQVTVSTPNRVTTLNSSGSESDLYYPEDTSACADLLSLRFSVYSQFDGDWPVLSVNFSSASQIVFTIRMPDLDSSDWDFTNQGQAGVFTDRIRVDNASVGNGYWPAVGDTLFSQSLPSGGSLQVQGTISAYIFVGPVTGTTEIPYGQTCLLQHTGRVISLRDSTSTITENIDDVVPGDVLTIEDQPTRYTVRRIYRNPDLVATRLDINADGTAATFYATAADFTQYFSPGDTIFVSRAGRLSGEWIVSAIATSRSMTVYPPAGSTLAALLPTYAGEAEIFCRLYPRHMELSLEGTFIDSYTSSITVDVASRFVPGEAAGSTSDTLPASLQYQPRQFRVDPYSDQELVHSTMANNNLFLTNYQDPIQKWDGNYILRAGLPRWNPALFLVTSTTGGGTIALPSGTAIAGTTTSGVFTATTANQTEVLQPGQKVTATSGGTLRVVTVATVNATTGVVTFVEPQSLNGIPAGTTSLTTQSQATYKYYFRAHAVDANGFVLATASAASEDVQVQITSTTGILLRLLGMPVFPGLDYDRIRVRVYRTAGTGVPPYYFIAEQDMYFGAGHRYNQAEGRCTGSYLDIRDAVPDLLLQQTQTDALAPILSQSGAAGVSFPTVEPVPRAKYITTIGNQAAYANLKSNPRILLQLVAQPSQTFNLSESWLYRVSSAYAGTYTADNANVFGFRFVESAGVGGKVQTISTITVGSGYFDVSISGVDGSMTAGQWVYLCRTTASTVSRTTFMGWWQVASTQQAGNTGTATPMIVRINLPGISSYVYNAGSDVTTAVLAGDPNVPADINSHIPVYLGADFNYDRQESRRSGSNNLDTFPSNTLYSVTTRFAMAFNVAMRASTGIPFATAQAGDTFPTDGASVLLEMVDNASLTAEEQLYPTLELGYTEAVANRGGFILFANDVSRSQDATITSVELLRPSRLLLALPNYPELVDNPFSADPARTLSCVDVNPADGQEITGIIPFFGESAFGGAVTSGQLVVFKTDSIYFVDPATRQLAKVESQGVGCAAPGSIAVTRQGIIFAHTSGIFRLTRAQTIEPLGANLDRLWSLVTDTSAEALAVMQAHNYAATRRYRLFFPAQTDAGDEGDTPRNSGTFSYDYTAEAKGELGGWSRYDNHAVTNACNLLNEAFAGTWTGKVLRFLQVEEPESYRDDNAPVGMVRAFDSGSETIEVTGSGMQVTTRALDFGDPSIRKKVLHILLGFRLPVSSDGTGVSLTGTVVSQAVDLRDSFTTLDAATVEASTVRDGLSSEVGVKQRTIRYSPATSKAVYHQVRLEDFQLNAPVVLVSLSYRVTGLSSKGTTQAANTSTART